MRIRRAEPAEAQLLSEVAMESKGHWGYDPDFLEACRPELTLTPESIEGSEVHVIEANGEVIGFYGLGKREDDVELGHFWVLPKAIGQGFGKRLWEHAIDTARRLGFRRLWDESDPNAKGFYRKMGAKRVGEVPSPVQAGRMLPLLRFSLRDSESPPP